MNWLYVYASVFAVALAAGWTLLRLSIRPVFSLFVAEGLLAVLVVVGAIEDKAVCVMGCMRPSDLMFIFLVYQVVLLLPVTGAVLASYFLIRSFKAAQRGL
jgi:hypothetical protein